MDTLFEDDETGISGVITRELAEIPAPGGPVLHMLRSDSPLFKQFGEIYFSEIEPGAVKAWKRHREQSQAFAVPSGLIVVVIYDDRPGSPSFGVTERFILGRPDNYRLLYIPPLLWYGFSGQGTTPSLLANLADMPHRPEESDRIPFDDPRIPYAWHR